MKFTSLLTLNLIGINCQTQPVVSKGSSDILQNFFEDTKLFFDNFNLSLFGSKSNSNINTKDKDLSSSAITENFENIKKFNLISINEQEAKKWLKYSALAYCPEDKILEWTCPDCNLDNSTDIERYYLQNPKFENSGYVMANKKEKIIVIGFKGTKTTINWVMNVKSDYFDPNLSAPYNDAKIHSGFYEMSQVLYPDMKDYLTKLMSKYPKFKIYMTGHSMGGALATISAFNLVIDNILAWEQISLITYGQPRVGNQEFADYLNSQKTIMTRVNREGDPVPTVPTPPLYYHHGHNFYIHFDDSTTLCMPSDISWECNTSPINMQFDYHFSFWNVTLDSKCGIIEAISNEDDDNNNNNNSYKKRF